VAQPLSASEPGQSLHRTVATALLSSKVVDNSSMADHCGAPSARTLFGRGSAAPPSTPSGFAAHSAGAGEEEKQKQFGRGRTERANAENASANVSVLRSRGRLDRPAPGHFGKARATTKAKTYLGKVERERFSALATSPGLQRGAQVASLQSLILCSGQHQSRQSVAVCKECSRRQ